ncbi:MAG: alkaline phosphatase D, partial [Pseudoalteromonas tetraodonis]
PFTKFVIAVFCLATSSALFGQDGEPTNIRVTHGPILGRPTTTSMSLWVRTERPGEVVFFYGLDAKKLDRKAALKTTSLDRDYTGVLTIDGLEPDTRYHYRIEDHQLAGAFRTLPSTDDYKHPVRNPEGLFNFKFEFACGNNQRGNGDSGGATLPAFDTLNREVRDSIHFAIQNGDWLYENRREYNTREWMHQVGLDDIAAAPDIVRKSPPIVGIWENYKTYLTRGRNLSEWHRHVPTFYTADDHEFLNDIYGTAERGYSNRRALIRDTGMRAWFDYLAWANPVEHSAEAWFGRSKLKAGSDILVDPNADFTKLDLGAMANLHVHWGTETAGVMEVELDKGPHDPNAAVYDILEVLGPKQLRIAPAAKADTDSVYSIGRRAYGKFSVSNCDFFLLDTRSHRDMHDLDHPDKPGASMLGKQQLKWLKDGISASEADFVFVVSSVNFMVPHVGSGGGKEAQVTVKKDDAWTVFLEEREELIEFWDALEDKSVFVLTGDLHNSFAIKVTDNVHEFASGPHNSINHAPAVDEGDRPANGKFKYGPRECDIRWSSYVSEDIPRANRTFPHYCVVQVNNVFNNPLERDGERWFAFPHPQVIFQFFNALTGELAYSETIVLGLQ